MSNIQIKVTPETLRKVSADTSQKIKKVQDAFVTLESIIQNTSSYWDGDGQSACVEAYQYRKDDYEKIFKSFLEHIINLEQIAGVYQESEDFAEDLSTDLPSDVII
mgnify:CR=1 FL=1